MKSKKEMIQIIAEIIESDAQHYYRYEVIAANVLDALCGALPDVRHLRKSRDLQGFLLFDLLDQQDINQIYFRLKQWGENDTGK
jgi:hypothetical protein